MRAYHCEFPQNQWNARNYFLTQDLEHINEWPNINQMPAAFQIAISCVCVSAFPNNVDDIELLYSFLNSANIF